MAGGHGNVRSRTKGMILYLGAVDSFRSDNGTMKRNFPSDVDNTMKRLKVDAGKKCSGVLLTRLTWLELTITTMIE